MKVALRVSTVLTLAAVATTAAAQSGSTVRVLGVELGGKFAIGAICANSSKPPSQPCWLDRPFKHNGAQLGAVMLPAPETRPQWAAYGPFDVHLSSKGTLEQIKVRTAAPKGEVASSIRERFGLPATVTNIPEKGIHAAEWIAPGLVVKMLCIDHRDCSVDFVSAAQEAIRLRDAESRRQAHPKAP